MMMIRIINENKIWFMEIIFLISFFIELKLVSSSMLRGLRTLTLGSCFLHPSLGNDVLENFREAALFLQLSAGLCLAILSPVSDIVNLFCPKYG